MTKKIKRDPPMSVRFTRSERERLVNLAAGMPYGAFIKWRVFAPDSPPPKQRGQTPIKDHIALAAIAAKLGQSKLANNLNQLAKAANSGSLVMTPEAVEDIRATRLHIEEIRDLLVKVIGLREGGR